MNRSLGKAIEPKAGSGEAYSPWGSTAQAQVGAAQQTSESLHVASRQLQLNVGLLGLVVFVSKTLVVLMSDLKDDEA